MPFASLGLSPSLSNPLARLGYTTPTPVQLKSIPIVLTGKDLLAQARRPARVRPRPSACR